MNAILCLFIGIFAVMILAFVIDLIKAWILEIRYQWKKRKAVKENSPDKWMYNI